MRFAHLAAVLLFTWSAYAGAQQLLPCDATTIFFLNGVNYPEEKQNKALKSIRGLFERRLSQQDFGLLKFRVARNPTEGLYDDLVESAAQAGANTQIEAWLGLLGRNDLTPEQRDRVNQVIRTTILSQRDVDVGVLQQHVDAYHDEITQKRRNVIVVSHSQGNLFANQEAVLLTTQGDAYAFAIVAVATPEGVNAKPAAPELGSAHITLKDDDVIREVTSERAREGLSTLPGNIENTGGGGHDLLKYYLAEGSNSESLIYDITLNSIRGLRRSSCGQQANQPPIASFSASVGNANTLTVAVGQEITFDPRASRDPDGQIVSYAWDFGDGSGLSDSRPDLQPHIYTTPGPKTVRLTVTDDRGATNPESAELTISVVAIQGNRPPVASFTATPSVVKVSGIVRLDASASRDPDGTIATYAWDFGDGQTSNPGPSIYDTAYAAPGIYQAQLTVTDNEGAATTVTREIHVTETDPGVILYDNPAFGGGCMQFLKQGDRYIIAARLGNGVGGSRTDFGHTLLRVSATGAVDPTFGSGGSVSISNLTPGFENIDGSSDLCLGAIDSLGRIVLSSSSLRTVGDANVRAHVVRLTENGALDTSFAGQGIFRLDNARFDLLQTMANRITVDAFDRIIVAGQSVRLTCPFSTCFWEGLAFRINADGALDDSFNGGTGVFTWTDPIAGYQPFVHSYFSGVAVDAVGRILLGGCTSRCANYQGETYAVRLTPAGILDTSFGDQGNRLLPLYSAADPTNVTSMPGIRTIQGFSFGPDDRILATGWNYYSNMGSTIYRLLPDGALDPTFTYGSVLSDFGWVRPFMSPPLVGQFIQNGKATLVGSTYVAYYDDYLAVSRLNADGTPDVSFNQADLAYPSTPAQRTWHLVLGSALCNEPPGGAFMQPDGRIIVAGSYACGYPYTRGGIYLMRINGDGSIDSTFGR